MIEKGKISQEPFIGILKNLEEAESANLVDWNAMNIASVGQMNQPSSRMVLLKKISDDGLVFYTNYNSRKGKEIELNPKVAVNFWWRELKKQIRVEGFIKKASEKDSNQLLNYTNILKNNSIEIKKDIIEHLWKVIISDKTVDQYESNLMRRICGLIYFSDKECGEIKLNLINNK